MFFIFVVRLLFMSRTSDEIKFSVYLNVFYFFIFIFIYFIVRQREFREICSSSLASLLPARCISFLFCSMEFHCYPHYIATFSFDRSKLHENLIDELFLLRQKIRNYVCVPRAETSEVITGGQFKLSTH